MIQQSLTSGARTRRTAKLRLAGIGGVLAIFLCSILVHPFGHVKNQNSGTPLLTGAHIDASAKNILIRSCQDCHSGKTSWPWYSYVAPMSWMIERDVSQARNHMNFSRWGEYDSETKMELLDTIPLMVHQRLMPLPHYLRLHPEARMSAADIKELARWASAEQERLQATSNSLNTGVR
jgi:hypothetical protein